MFKLLENRLAAIRGNARPGVTDRKTDPPFARRFQNDANAATIGEFDRISCKVHQNLAQTIRISRHAPRHIEIDGRRDFNSLSLRTRRQKLRDALDKGGEIKNDIIQLKFAGLDF